MLTFGLPLYVRGDPESEFTAEVMQHLCKWLNGTIAYGPVDHPCTQGTMERLGGWLHEALGELCKTWPRRWDEYVQPALWIHRTTPDLRLLGKPTPFRLFFGRDARTQLDATHAEINGGDFRCEMHSYVADKGQAYTKVRDVRVALLKRHEDRQKSRESRNNEKGRTSVGARVVGGNVLVKEAESVMARGGIQHKLADGHWTLGGDCSCLTRTQLHRHDEWARDSTTTGVSSEYQDVPLTSGRPPSRLRKRICSPGMGS